MIQINWLGFVAPAPFFFFELYQFITYDLSQPFLHLSFYYVDSFIFQKIVLRSLVSFSMAHLPNRSCPSLLSLDIFIVTQESTISSRINVNVQCHLNHTLSVRLLCINPRNFQKDPRSSQSAKFVSPTCLCIKQLTNRAAAPRRGVALGCGEVMLSTTTAFQKVIDEHITYRQDFMKP